MKRATIERRCSSEDVWKYIKKGNNNTSHVFALTSKNKDKKKHKNIRKKPRFWVRNISHQREQYGKYMMMSSSIVI